MLNPIYFQVENLKIVFFFFRFFFVSADVVNDSDFLESVTTPARRCTAGNFIVFPFDFL